MLKNKQTKNKHQMKLNEIQNLIRFVAKSGVSEIDLELEDFKIRIRNPSSEKETIFTEMSVPPSYVQAGLIQATPIASSNPAETIPVQKESLTPLAATDESKYHIVKAPMIGTFYRTSDSISLKSFIASMIQSGCPFFISSPTFTNDGFPGAEVR